MCTNIHVRIIKTYENYFQGYRNIISFKNYKKSISKIMQNTKRSMKNLANITLKHKNNINIINKKFLSFD